jgi:aminopeptidase
MKRNFDENVYEYAKLVVEVGVNIQKGQKLYITSPIETADFARALTQAAYKVGAYKVHVNYVDEKINKITYEQAPKEALEEYPKWLVDGKEILASENAAFITISAQDPDLLKDVDPKRIGSYHKAAGKALENFRRYIQNGDVSWCVVSIPTASWSKKVFPEAKEAEEAISLLWDKIFIATRIYEENPIKAWKEHTKNLEEKTKFLNEQKITKLHYQSEKTDLVVELPKGHIWQGGGSYNKVGTYYVANMPTEEVFTMPYKYGVNGKLASTKPLNYGGNLIDNFVLYFEKGKVVDYSAEMGYESLKELLETDEGSKYLGEVAIVPHHSPVSNTGIIFFNTLFDENASCHFALGSAYPDTIEGGVKMSKEELEEVGANTSLNHEDFMVGGEGLTIEATREDGTTFCLLRKGDWAV